VNDLKLSKVSEWTGEAEEGEEEEEEEEERIQTKNKNPTRQCGENDETQFISTLKQARKRTHPGDMFSYLPIEYEDIPLAGSLAVMGIQ